MTQRSFTDLARYLLAGANDLSGGFAPTATAQELLADYERRAARRTRETILDEMKAGRAPVVPASDDDGIAIVLRVYEAHRRGCARQALRLLVAVLNGMAVSGPVYAAEFARYERVLADLSREEIILLGALIRHHVGVTEDERNTLSGGDIVHKALCDELIPTPFRDEDSLDAHWSALQRTGLIMPGKTIGFTVPSPLLYEVAELASFEDVLRREGEQI
jgi:hypothetical protein